MSHRNTKFTTTPRSSLSKTKNLNATTQSRGTPSRKSVNLTTVPAVTPNKLKTARNRNIDQQDQLDLNYNRYLQTMMSKALFDDAHKQILNDIDRQAVKLNELFGKYSEMNNLQKYEIDCLTNSLKEFELTNNAKHLSKTSITKIETKKTLNLINNITKKFKERSNTLELCNIDFENTPESQSELVSLLKNILKSVEKLKKLYTENKTDVLNNVTGSIIEQDEELQKKLENCQNSMETVQNLLLIASADKFLLADSAAN